MISKDYEPELNEVKKNRIFKVDWLAGRTKLSCFPEIEAETSEDFLLVNLP